MNQSHFLGKTVHSFKDVGNIGPIAGVAVVIDNEHEYTAYANADKSGYILTVECPYGTEQMAKDILAKVSGKVYKGFEATGAKLPIEAELGDSIVVNGTSVFLGYQRLRFGPGHMSDISAPSDNEVDHEYPYTGTAEKVHRVETELNRQKVTIDFINGITVEDDDGTTRIKGSEIRTSDLYATKLKGKTVYLIDDGGSESGTMTIGTAQTASHAIELSSGGALRFLAESGAIFLSNGVTNVTFSSNDPGLIVTGNIVPGDAVSSGAGSTSVYNVGNQNYKWNDVYIKSGPISTSDIKNKNSIEDLPQKYVDFIFWLAPKRYKLNDGTSGRYHVGFIAQDVEEGMSLFGIDSMEFGGFVKADDTDGNAIYMLRYEEFIAIILGAVQRQKNIIEDHENRLSKLEAMINGG